jgi:hypothetical protein
VIDFAETHVEFILEFLPVLFPLDGFNDPFGRGIVPIRSGRQERITFSVRVVSVGGTENGGRCPSTVIENRTVGRKRRRNDHPSV